jgi:hypothetical protein
MESADTKQNGASTAAPAQASNDSKPTAVAFAPATESVVTSVHRPSPGAINVVEVPQGAHLKLDFATTDAKFAILDVDLVLLFPDGGKIIFPGYAFNLVGPDSSDAVFADKAVSPQQLLAFVDELHLLSDNSSPILGSSAAAQQQNQNAGKDQGEAKDQTAEEAPPSPPPQPAAPSAKYTGVADFEKPPEPPADRFLKKPPDDAIPASSGAAPGSHHTSDGTPTTTSGPTTDPGGGTGNVSAAHLDIILFGVSGDRVATLPSGGEPS